MGHEVVKTEHNGAKNGGGYWGRRADAKIESDKRRRTDDRTASTEGLTEWYDEAPHDHSPARGAIEA